jgi:hypothetical protein
MRPGVGFGVLVLGMANLWPQYGLTNKRFRTTPVTASKVQP